MTNAEKFKTPEQRVEAHTEWCEEKGKPNGCYQNCHECAFAWLDLEAEKEKPMPCPFCGYDTDIEHTSLDCDTDEWYGVRCLSCEYVSKNYHLLDEAISAHNRVCKAVAAYKKSEVELRA